MFLTTSRSSSPPSFTFRIVFTMSLFYRSAKSSTSPAPHSQAHSWSQHSDFPRNVAPWVAANVIEARLRAGLSSPGALSLLPASSEGPSLLFGAQGKGSNSNGERATSATFGINLCLHLGQHQLHPM